ncbi:MAG: biopolymer transporter ExbD [Gammaproteobacteria bacterium]|nr:biopolymer transporter ExbD [Gammaproteobacteria bacterium]MBU2426198.1 biopolymer transporter ExbD [Gammaproteobacteria bacterium]
MAFGGDFDNNDEVMSEINMTPLVDVMLVLLIIFIITVPVLTHSVEIDLPRASNQPNELKPTTVQLAVDAAGEVYWNESKVTATELTAKLTAAAAANPQPEIHLRGDRTVAYEHVVKTMAAVQQAGILKLGFVTEPAP